jgi:hypothetical protein
MEFTRRLRARVQRGEITCSVRIWLRPHVKPGHRYRIEGGEIEVDSIEQIELADITPELARASGFVSVIDLLKTAKHGRGSNVYLRVSFTSRSMSAARDGSACGSTAMSTGLP